MNQPRKTAAARRHRGPRTRRDLPALPARGGARRQDRAVSAAALWTALSTRLPHDPLLLWVQIAMLSGIVLALLATWLVVRANARLDARIARRRAQRRERGEAVQAAVEALAGRPLQESGPPR